MSLHRQQGDLNYEKVTSSIFTVDLLSWLILSLYKKEYDFKQFANSCFMVLYLFSRQMRMYMQ